MKKFFVSISFVFVFGTCLAQYEYRDSNRIGISIGANQLQVFTNDFDVKSILGVSGGLSVRGNFFDNWDALYAMQFSQNSFSVAGSNGSLEKDIVYKLSSAQIAFLFSYKIFDHYCSVEMGPLVQVNGQLEMDTPYKDWSIGTAGLMAKDILNVSKINVYPVVGITSGLKHVRLNLTYQYSLNNFFTHVNPVNGDEKLKANLGIVTASMLFYL